MVCVEDDDADDPYGPVDGLGEFGGALVKEVSVPFVLFSGVLGGGVVLKYEGWPSTSSAYA